MAQAYCVKDKMKVEVVNPQMITIEERQAGASGHLSEVRHQGLQDRRLILRSRFMRVRPALASPRDRSRTFEVRSLSCSTPPWPDLA